MSNYSKAIIIWLDSQINRLDHYRTIKKLFARIIGSEWNSNVPVLDDDTIEDYINHDLSASSYSYGNNTIDLHAFTDEDECTECIKENRNEHIFFIVSYALGKRLVPQIITNYQGVFKKSSNHRHRSIYVLSNKSTNIDKLWQTKYSEYMLCFPEEMDLVKKLINDVGDYFINLGQKQYDHGTLPSIRQSLGYFEEAKVLFERAFGVENTWQCRQGMHSIDKQIDQCKATIRDLTDDEDIDQCISFSRTVNKSEEQTSLNILSSSDPTKYTDAPSGTIGVYLHSPAIQTESYKNLFSTLKFILDTNLVVGKTEQDYGKLFKTTHSPIIVCSLLDANDEVTLEKLCLHGGTSITVYILGIEPQTVQAKKDFYTKYPQVHAVLDNPEELAVKIALDVAMKSRIMGEQYMRNGNKESANKLFNQCIELLNQLNVFSRKHVDNIN